MQYLSQSRIFELAQTLKEFSITWATTNGHWAHIERAAMTSQHGEGDTINIINLVTGEVSKVIIDTIKEFANKEVII